MANYRKSTLENGVRVVTDGMPGSRAVSIGVIVDTGPAAEGPLEAGLAHLCEHLLFQGTSNRSGLEIARLMDGAGGRVGGFTSRDYTCFYAIVLDDYLTYALDLLGDVLLNPTFPDGALVHEKRSICNEIAARQDDPEQRAHELLKGHVWRQHPLGRSIAGDPEDIVGFDREDLIYFVHQNYLPERIIIAAAGNLNHEDFVAQVRDAFWRLLPSVVPPPQRQPPQFVPGLIFERVPSAQAYFALGLEMPAYARDDRYVVHALDQVLGGGMSSRLFHRLREQCGLVYSVTSTYHAYREAGIILIEGSTAPEDLVEVLEATLEVVDDLATWRRPVDEEELARARARLSAGLVLASEDSHSRMSRMATQELYFRRYLSEEEMLADIEAVDLGALYNLATGPLQAALGRRALAVVAAEEPLLGELEILGSRRVAGDHAITEVPVAC